VPQLYDIDTGAVRLNGVDVRDLSFAALRDTVGVVTQDEHLFHDTIAGNLRFAAPDARDEQLWEALRGARPEQLVRSLPDGLDTVVGDRGYRLSGGERQRLTIARLLLARPRVVILDEATAHLDSESVVHGVSLHRARCVSAGGPGARPPGRAPNADTPCTGAGHAGRGTYGLA
jgi:ABC-type multidrug transport system fused ATPase/permease subunit